MVSSDYFPEDKSIIFLDEPNRLTEKGEAVEDEYRQSRMHREEKEARICLRTGCVHLNSFRKN